MKVEPYIHRCTVREGAAAGNKYSQKVNAYQLDQPCDVCGEPLMTLEQLAVHLYEELTQ